MKKTLLTLLAAGTCMLGFASTAMADYGMAGCGLGTLVFKSNTTLYQLLAATTNGTFGNQTFGITSGTSNCTAGGVVKADKEQEAFVEANFPSLQSELAAGEGEYFTAFAGVLGCDLGGTSALADFTQANYEQLSGTDVTPLGLLYSVKSGMAQHPVLRNSCSRI